MEGISYFWRKLYSIVKINKQNKLSFYIKGFARTILPLNSLEKEIAARSKNLNKDKRQEVEKRVHYYNKISEKIKVDHRGTTIQDLLKPKTPKSYYFDTYEFARFFPRNYLIDYAFGDVNRILEIPTITKSRPIHGNNENNIILNLDKARHFVSVEDQVKFSAKKNVLIGRAAIFQQHRLDFYERYFNHPICDLGQVNTIGGKEEWIKPKISLKEHLQHKFILSLEGNDVATNLKWIMSSNSIAVSPPLKMETWYMEGTLKPDEHFIGLDEDYTNLEEKIQHYIDHPKEALEIIENAKHHRNQFEDQNKEKLISLLVLKKYFEYIH